MARPIAQPLRVLTAEERAALTAVTRCPSQPRRRHQRATALLAVAEGATLTAAAAQGGWQVGDTVAALVRRFNRLGVAALDDQPRPGRPPWYTEQDETRILAEVRRPADREQDGTATWSLSTLQRALRAAPDGLPAVSTYTLFRVLHAAGYSWQRDRSWCTTGVVLRKRKAGVVRVVDPEADQKRGGSSGPTGPASDSGCRSGPRTRAGRTRRFPSPAPPGSRKGSPPAGRTNTSAAARPSC